MGKAVPRIIKQRSNELLKAYPDNFSREFEKNKEFLKSLELPFSKTELNLMSGFISRKFSAKED